MAQQLLEGRPWQDPQPRPDSTEGSRAAAAVTKPVRRQTGLGQGAGHHGRCPHC